MIGLKTLLRKEYNYLLLILVLLLGCPPKKEKPKEPLYTETTCVMKKGENLEAVLNKLSLSSTTVSSLLNVLQKGGFPSRKCIPGDSIKILKKDNEFLKFTYRKSPIDIFYVLKDSQNYLIAMKFPYIDTTINFLKGEVKSTLYESFIQMGETPNLVFRFADIFAWEVDFTTETRTSDSFFVLLNKSFCDSIFVDYCDIVYARYKGDIGDFHGIYFCDPKGHDDYYNLKGQSLRKSLLKSPLRYSYISSYFSKRRFHPILKVWRPHHGLDYKAPTGTPVSSIGDGVITYKGWKGGYGKLIEIRHKNNFKTRYGHLSRYAKGMYKGKRVKMGQLIGYVGSTGLSTGPHLHFEMHKYGKPINPLKVKIPRAPSVKKKNRSGFEQKRDSLLKYIEEIEKPKDDIISMGK
jgi:murein DD-endopeptidase MepM/ murein hydrolase activator NlpD